MRGRGKDDDDGRAGATVTREQGYLLITVESPRSSDNSVFKCYVVHSDEWAEALRTKVRSLREQNGMKRLDVEGPGLAEPLTPCGWLTMAVGSASAQSDALFGSVVEIVSTVDCYLAFGANPTAVGDSGCFFLPAFQARSFALPSSEQKFAVIAAAPGDLLVKMSGTGTGTKKAQGRRESRG